MENLMCRFGKVVSLWFLEEKINGKSKGTCFCQFENIDQARMARDSLKGTEINGKQIVVAYTSGLPSSRFSGPSEQTSSGRGVC
jgi:RNA recognition motif-containing protein